ncbi:MAG: FAD-dependent oxidoreductase [Candidatus Desulfofervidaceae bacterium]|nr:FAD-dependent oxidoreductase [Candidatus Desulfofervidaceae bacterium]
MRVVIVGAVAAGPKAACRIKRLLPEAEVVMVDKDDIISYGACGIPYFISGDVPILEELFSTNYHVVRDTDFFANSKGVKVLPQTEAIGIDRKKKEVFIKNLVTGKEEVLSYDKLVLATGSIPFIPPIPGINAQGVFSIVNLHDAQTVLDLIKRGEVERAVIIGGGAIGIEMAEALTDMWGVDVTIVEMMPHLLPGIIDTDISLMLKTHLEMHGVRLVCNAQVKEIKTDETGRVKEVIASSEALPADLVIVATGVRPNTKLAQEAGLLVSPQGIVVNQRMQTSDPDIYAGGDCVENRCLITGKGIFISSGSIANRHGRVIGTNIAGGLELFEGVVRSFVIKAFDLCIAKTGLCEEAAQKEGFEVIPVMIVQLDRAHFYPTKQLMYFQLTVEKNTQRVLGAQAVGINGDAVVGKINTVASMLKFKPTVDDLSILEIAYAPPFGTAVDILNTAGNVAKNTLAGKNRTISISEFLSLWQQRTSGEYIFLDVRETADAKPYVEKLAPYWINIPQREFRKRLAEVPTDKKIVIICNTGMRSYEIQLLLDKIGISQTFNLRGGMAALKMTGIDLVDSR